MASKVRSIDYYQDLGLERTASYRDIKIAYMKLAKQHHPDKNLGTKSNDATDFRRVQTAYETLRDPEQRAKYDKRTKAASTIGSRRTQHEQKKATAQSQRSFSTQDQRPSTNHFGQGRSGVPPSNPYQPFYTTDYGWYDYTSHYNRPEGPYGAQYHWYKQRHYPFFNPYAETASTGHFSQRTTTSGAGSPADAYAEGLLKRSREYYAKMARDRAAAVEEAITGRPAASPNSSGVPQARQRRDGARAAWRRAVRKGRRMPPQE